MRFCRYWTNEPTNDSRIIYVKLAIDCSHRLAERFRHTHFLSTFNIFAFHNLINNNEYERLILDIHGVQSFRCRCTIGLCTNGGHWQMGRKLFQLKWKTMPRNRQLWPQTKQIHEQFQELFLFLWIPCDCGAILTSNKTMMIKINIYELEVRFVDTMHSHRHANTNTNPFYKEQQLNIYAQKSKYNSE